MYWAGDQIYVYFFQEYENWEGSKREEITEDPSISSGEDDVNYCGN